MARPPALSPNLTVPEHPGGGALMTPSFGQNYSEADDDVSVHTNSTGDEGAADAAASAVLDLSLIRKSSPASPAQEPAEDPAGEGCATGEATPEDREDTSPEAGVDLRQVSAVLQQRRGSTASGPTSPQNMRRAGTALLSRPNQRRCLSPSQGRSPRRAPSYRLHPNRSSQQPDGLPTDCLASGTDGSASGSVASSAAAPALDVKPLSFAVAVDSSAQGHAKRDQRRETGEG